MISIPKLSAPLTKAIRTSEGILVWVVNLSLAAAALLEPSKLPPKEAAIVAGALTGLHLASRTLLKATALQQGIGIPAPPASQLKLPATTLNDANLAKIISDVVAAAGHPDAVFDQAVSDAEEFAHQPPAPAKLAGA